MRLKTDAPPHVTNEYLRRNLIHAASVGVVAGLQHIRARAGKSKRAPKWLFRSLELALVRAELARGELARHRNEVQS